MKPLFPMTAPTRATLVALSLSFAGLLAACDRKPSPTPPKPTTMTTTSATGTDLPAPAAVELPTRR